MQQNDPNALPTQTAFSQQRIDAWRPLLTPVVVMLMLFVIGAVFTSFGVVFYFTCKNTEEVAVRYDNLVGNQTSAIVPITLDREMHGNIWLFYKLTRFYQNHRRYIYSRSDSQLRGEFVDYADMTDCDGFKSVNDSKEMKDWYLPSGAIPLSFFNDSYSFVEENISILEAGISWRSDREKLFKKLSPKYTEGVRWLENNTYFPNEIRNEHFIVWMRAASLPTFLKPYARINTRTMPAGTYHINITNNYPLELFKGEKWLVLTTLSNIGGKNPILGWSYIIFGCTMFFFMFVVMISHIFFPRTLGDTSYLIADQA